MSMPIEKFVLSLELSAKNLHDTIAQWTSFDAELRENYRDNIKWLVERGRRRAWSKLAPALSRNDLPTPTPVLSAGVLIFARPWRRPSTRGRRLHRRSA